MPNRERGILTELEQLETEMKPPPMTSADNPAEIDFKELEEQVLIRQRVAALWEELFSLLKAAPERSDPEEIYFK